MARDLALFAVLGTQKALYYGLNPVTAALFGMLTGIGGGIVRDLLVTGIPTVLRADLYAIAALGGAAVVVTGHTLYFSPTVTAVAGAGLCFRLRLMAIFCGWHLPIARPPQRRIEGADVLNAGPEAWRGNNRPDERPRKNEE